MARERKTVKSRRVSQELRRYREKAGLSVTEAARRLDMSQAQLSRLELGTRSLKIADVAKMLGLYEVSSAKTRELLALVREAADPGWWAPTAPELPADWQTFIDFERKATALISYESVMVPGLLQTPDYARAIIEGVAETELSEDELDTKVAARLGRQSVLSRRNPPRLEALIFEPVLHIPVGGPNTMRHQLRHLVEMAERPAISIQVIPMTAGAHPGLHGSFLIMEFQDQPALVFTDSATRSAFLEEEELKRYRLAVRRLRHLAWTAAESMEYIDRVATKMA